MGATESFALSLPTEEDLDATQAAWNDNRVVHRLTVGETWFRVVRASSPAEALDRASVCYPSPSLSRFTPIVDRSSVQVPSAYAGRTDVTALWESVLRDIRHSRTRVVPQHETRDRYLVQVKLARELRLLNVLKPENVNLVARVQTPDLSAQPRSGYGATRAWSQQIYSRLPDIDGLIYESHQVRTDCIVLLQAAPKAVRVFDPVGDAQFARDEPVRSLLAVETSRVGAIVDFEDP